MLRYMPQVNAAVERVNRCLMSYIHLTISVINTYLWLGQQIQSDISVKTM